VNYLLEHPEERQQMRQRAHTLAQGYTWEVVADERVALYRRLLGDKLAQKPSW